MARMGKQQLTPEEEARNKMLMRERDRERKRMKRMNPEYRKMEQERDRDRKKARRANEAFRQLEKLRDKIRKDRKKGLIVDDVLPQDFNNLPPVSVEPEVIISDVSPVPSNQQQTVQQITTNSNNQTSNGEGNHSINNNNSSNSNSSISTTSASQTVTQTTSSTAVAIATTVPPSTSNSATLAPHMSSLSKGLLYPPHSFPHHPLPHIPGVSLMPQLCHPMLHQNIGSSLYPPNGIKQEYNENVSQRGSNGAQNGNSEQDREYSLIEPEIILQTSPDIIAAPHHFHNHAHAHHLHQQHAWSQAHMPPHMRAHPSMPPQTHPAAPQQQQQQVPPPPQNSTQQQQQQQHHNQQQQQIQMPHYNNQNKNS